MHGHCMHFAISVSPNQPQRCLSSHDYVAPGPQPPSSTTNPSNLLSDAKTYNIIMFSVCSSLLFGKHLDLSSAAPNSIRTRDPTRVSSCQCSRFRHVWSSCVKHDVTNCTCQCSAKQPTTYQQLLPGMMFSRTNTK